MPRVTHTSGGRWRTSAHDGLAFGPGETKDVSEEVAGWLLERGGFERAGGDETDADADATGEPEQPSIEAALDGTIDGLEGDLASGAYDDRLDELESAERESKDRQGALDAIDARRDEAAEE